MTNGVTRVNLSVFETIKQTDEKGNEFWTARQLAKVLEYTDFRNFIAVIIKAREACINSGQQVENHIVEFNEMVPILRNHTVNEEDEDAVVRGFEESWSAKNL